MSQVIEQISKEVVDAMKAKDEAKISTLRLLMAAFKNKQIEIGHELNDAEAREVVVKSAKQRRESIEAYEKGNRADLAAKEKAELKILEKYLPAQMSVEEITKVVDETIAESGAKTKADMGRVMGAVMSKLSGRADGTVVSKLVSEKLSG